MLPLILLSWVPKLLVAAGLFVLGFRGVRALERRGAEPAELGALRERVQALEDAMAEQGQELRRVVVGQEFTEQLLAQRASGPSDASARVPARPRDRTAAD